MLRRLGTQILSQVAPEFADEAEAAALARQEAQAHAARTLILAPAGDGRVRLSGWLDSEAAATVRAALDPLCAPRRTHDRNAGPARRSADPMDDLPRGSSDAGEAWPGERRTAGQRRADALVELCQLALHSGQRLTAGQVRRLACDAQVLPAVLGGEGQVLDVGQSRRLINGPLRRALVLRDGGCAFPRLRPPGAVVPRGPHQVLGGRRTDGPGQRRTALWSPPSAGPRLGGAVGSRQQAGVRAARLRRPAPPTAP